MKNEDLLDFIESLKLNICVRCDPPTLSLGIEPFTSRNDQRKIAKHDLSIV